MPSSAIPSIEATVAGPPAPTATAPTSASGGGSIFGVLIHEILQRGDSASDAVPAQAISAQTPANGAAVTNGAPGASSSASWTSGKAAATNALDAAGFSPYTSSVEPSAASANGANSAPEKPGVPTDNPTAAGGSGSSQATAALRNATLDLAIGKNVPPASSVLEGLAASVAAAQSGPSEASDGKPDQNAPTGSPLPAKPNGAARGGTNSTSVSSSAGSSTVLPAAPLGLPVLPVQAALPFTGATNSSVKNAGANGDVTNAGRSDTPVSASPDAALPTASAAQGTSAAQNQPGGASLEGLNFASTLTAAAAGSTSTTVLGAAIDGGTPTDTALSAPTVSDGTARFAVEQESASATSAKASAPPASQAIAEAATEALPTFTPAAAISSKLPAGFATLTADRETPAAESEPASTNEQDGSHDVGAIAPNSQIGVRSLVASALPPQVARLPQAASGLAIRALSAAVPKAPTSEVAPQSVAQKDATLTESTPTAALLPEALATITHPTDPTSSTSAPATLLAATHGAAAPGGAITAAADNSHTSGNTNSEQYSAYQADTAFSSSAGAGKSSATGGTDSSGNSGPTGIFAAASNAGSGNAAAANIATVNAVAASGQSATVAASAAPLAVPFAPHTAGFATPAPQASATPPDSSGAQTAAAPSLPASADAAARGAFVSNAQLGQSGTHSEMRVSLQSDNLGAIELHARVSGDSVGAAITVEKRDAHTMLATELPALQQALSDKQLRVEQITVLHAPMSATSGDAGANQFGGAGQGQTGGRGAQNSAGGGFGATLVSSFPFAAGFSADAGEIFDAQGRLSVHA